MKRAGFCTETVQPPLPLSTYGMSVDVVHFSRKLMRGVCLSLRGRFFLHVVARRFYRLACALTLL